MSYADVILGDSPALYWRLNETSGTNIDDATANGRDGTASGSPTMGAGGIDGTAINFDGTDDYITVSSTGLNAGATARTWECWLKFDAAVTNGSFMAMDGESAGRSFQWTIENDGSNNYVYGRFYANVLKYNTTALSTGTWYHIAIRVPSGASDTEDIEVYVNGTLQSSTLVSGSTQTLNTGGSTLYVGKNAVLNAYFDGVIDEVAVFNSALTTTQISEHYDAGVNGSATADVATATATAVEPTFVGQVVSVTVNPDAMTASADIGLHVSTSEEIQTIVGTDVAVANAPPTGGFFLSEDDFEFIEEVGTSPSRIFIHFDNVTMTELDTASVTFEANRGGTTDPEVEPRRITSAWTNSGGSPTLTYGDIAALNSDDASVFVEAGAAQAEYSVDVSGTVQEWIDGTDNNGIALISPGGTGVAVWNLSTTPKLTITKTNSSGNRVVDAAVAVATAGGIDPSVSISEDLTVDVATASATMPSAAISTTSNVEVAAAIATATASLVGPSAGSGVNVDSMDASAAMLMPTLPDYMHLADPMTATAASGDHEADPEVVINFNADVATATALMHDATVSLITEVDHNAGVMEATALMKGTAYSRTTDPLYIVTRRMAPAIHIDFFGDVAGDNVNSDNDLEPIGDFQFGEREDGRPYAIMDGNAYMYETNPSGLASNDVYAFAFRTTDPNCGLMEGPSLSEGHYIRLMNGRLKVITDLTTNPEQFSTGLVATGYQNLADGEWHFVVIEMKASEGSWDGPASGQFFDNRFGLRVWVDGEVDFIRDQFFSGNTYGPEYVGRARGKNFNGDLAYFAWFPRAETEEAIKDLNLAYEFAFAKKVNDTMDATMSMPMPTIETNTKDILVLFFDYDPNMGTGLVNLNGKLVQRPSTFSWLSPKKAIEEQFFRNGAYVFGDKGGQVVSPRLWSQNVDNVLTTAEGNFHFRSAHGYWDDRYEEWKWLDFDSVDWGKYDAFMVNDWPEVPRPGDYGGTAMVDILRSQFFENVRDKIDDGVPFICFDPDIAAALGLIDNIDAVSYNHEGLYDYYAYSQLDLRDYPTNEDALDGVQPDGQIGMIKAPRGPQLCLDQHYQDRFVVAAEVDGLTTIPDTNQSADDVAAWFQSAIGGLKPGQYDAGGRYSAIQGFCQRWVYNVEHNPNGWEVGKNIRFHVGFNGIVYADHGNWYYRNGPGYGIHGGKLNNLWGVRGASAMRGTPWLKGPDTIWHRDSEVQANTKDLYYATVIEKGTVVNGKPLGARVVVDFLSTIADVRQKFIAVNKVNTTHPRYRNSPWDWDSSRGYGGGTTYSISNVNEFGVTTSEVQYTVNGVPWDKEYHEYITPLRRELRWLMEEEDLNNYNYIAASMKANAGMVEPSLTVDRDNNFNARPAKATAQMREPDETGVKSVFLTAQVMEATASMGGEFPSNLANKATATATMLEPVITTEIYGEPLYVFEPVFDMHVLD